MTGSANSNELLPLAGINIHFSQSSRASSLNYCSRIGPLTLGPSISDWLHQHYYFANGLLAYQLAQYVGFAVLSAASHQMLFLVSWSQYSDFFFAPWFSVKFDANSQTTINIHPRPSPRQIRIRADAAAALLATPRTYHSNRGVTYFQHIWQLLKFKKDHILQSAKGRISKTATIRYFAIHGPSS